MSKKSLSLVLVLIAFSLVFSACTRSASTATAEPKTGEDSPLGPIATQPDILQEAITQATQGALQTQQAQGGVTPAAGADVATAVPAEATAVPTAVPTATPTMAAIPTLTRPASYTLQKGEFPYCIARRYNVSIADLLSLNGLGSGAVVNPGTALKIPSSGSWNAGDRALKSHPADYTVKAGDTIYTVACAYGDVDPMAIAIANALEEPYTLTAGKVIKIP